MALSFACANRGLGVCIDATTGSKNKFHSHLHQINFALKCIPEAVLDGLLLLAVAPKANLRDHPILVFWGPLTSPNT